MSASTSDISLHSVGPSRTTFLPPTPDAPVTTRAARRDSKNWDGHDANVDSGDLEHQESRTSESRSGLDSYISSSDGGVNHHTYEPHEEASLQHNNVPGPHQAMRDEFARHHGDDPVILIEDEPAVEDEAPGRGAPQTDQPGWLKKSYEAVQALFTLSNGAITIYLLVAAILA